MAGSDSCTQCHCSTYAFINSRALQTLLAHISPTDHAATLSVLLTSHSIFSAWRHATASDVLFGEMILVLKSYLKPFMQLFRMTATKLLSAPPTSSSIERAELETLAQAQAVLVDILYDFTCHEWPDLMEDVKGEFLAPGEGWLHRLLLWDPPQLRGEVNVRKLSSHSGSNSTIAR